MSSTKELRIVLIGQGGVGKSALCNAFVKDRFSMSYNPTEEEFYRQKLSVNGRNVIIDISDINQTSPNFNHTILNADAIMFVFDITSKASFNSVIELHKKALELKSVPIFNMVLIGNKSDMPDLREVSYEAGMRTALDWGCKFVEVSAKTNTQVSYAFSTCAGSALQQDIISDTQKKCCIIV